jgi:hypothetical protein
MGDRYQLKSKCLFVDAVDRDSNSPGRKPDDIKHAHVMDTNKKSENCLKLNDMAGFIARFVVQGVDVDVIPQILLSEYDYTQATTTPKDDVDKVVSMLYPDFVKKRAHKREYETPEPRGKMSHHGKYDLDFKVNWFGTGCCKF